MLAPTPCSEFLCKPYARRVCFMLFELLAVESSCAQPAQHSFFEHNISCCADSKRTPRLSPSLSHQPVCALRAMMEMVWYLPGEYIHKCRSITMSAACRARVEGAGMSASVFLYNDSRAMFSACTLERARTVMWLGCCASCRDNGKPFGPVGQ